MKSMPKLQKVHNEKDTSQTQKAANIYSLKLHQQYKQKE